MAVVLPIDAEVKVISKVLPPAGAAVQDHEPEPVVGVFPPNAVVVVPLHVVIFPKLVEVVGVEFTVIAPVKELVTVHPLLLVTTT